MNVLLIRHVRVTLSGVGRVSEVMRSKQHVLVVDGALASSEGLQLVVRVALRDDGGAEGCVVEQGPGFHRLAAAQRDSGRRGVGERVMGARRRLGLAERRLVLRLRDGPGSGHAAVA